MAVINGTSIGVYVGGTLVAASTSATINTNVAEINVTSKDSLGRKQILPGVSDWTVSGDYLDSVGDANYEYSDFHALYKNKTRVFIQVIDGSSLSYQGFAYLTSASREAPMEDVVTGSYSFTGDGLLNEVATT